MDSLTRAWIFWIRWILEGFPGLSTEKQNEKHHKIRNPYKIQKIQKIQGFPHDLGADVALPEVRMEILGFFGFYKAAVLLRLFGFCIFVGFSMVLFGFELVFVG